MPQTTCKCLNKKKQQANCSIKIGVERQKQIFDMYYQSMIWTQKTLFIRSSVKRQQTKTKKSDNYPIVAIKSKNFNNIYSLCDENGIEHVVCRDFFLNCIQIKSSRVFSALGTMSNNPSATECRGKCSPANKTTENNKNSVRQFIDSIPKYESHYGRSNSQKQYLSPTLNLPLLYLP